MECPRTPSPIGIFQRTNTTSAHAAAKRRVTIIGPSAIATTSSTGTSAMTKIAEPSTRIALPPFAPRLGRWLARMKGTLRGEEPLVIRERAGCRCAELRSGARSRPQTCGRLGAIVCKDRGCLSEVFATALAAPRPRRPKASMEVNRRHCRELDGGCRANLRPHGVWPWPCWRRSRGWIWRRSTCCIGLMVAVARAGEDDVAAYGCVSDGARGLRGIEQVRGGCSPWPANSIST
jgi:hypothetical protein